MLTGKRILLKIFIIMFCLVTVMSVLPGTDTAQAATSYDIIRVKLSMGEPTSVPFYIDGNYSVEGDSSVVLPRQAYTVTLSGSTLYLKYGSTTLYSGSSIKLVQNAATDGLNNFIRLDNSKYGYHSYLGDMEFKINSGYILVINHVYLDYYLYGVVPYEMSDSWPIEALKAQAVTARNYAVQCIGGDDNYDVVDTSGNQVYKGYNAANTNAIAAVDATAKRVLMCGSKRVDMYYSASNGGYTEIPQHVWSAGNTIMPYHIIQVDEYDAANPYSSQEVLIFPKAVSDTDAITYQYSSDGAMVTGTGTESANAERYLKISALSAVREQGYIASVTGDIKIVGISHITPHTYTDQHEILDYNGNDLCVYFEKADVTMTVRAKRYASSDDTGVVLGDVNGDGRISITDYSLIRLDILGIKDLDDIYLTAADVNGDGKSSITDYSLIRLHILGIKYMAQPPGSGELIEEAVTVTFTINMHEFDDQDGQYTAFNRTHLRLFVVTETDTAWCIYQRRYGHGIGVSQRGAQQRAKSDDPAVNTYDKILLFYYPNTEFGTISIEAPTLATLSTAPGTGGTNASISSTVNVRSGPSTGYSVIGNLSVGARIEVTAANHNGSEWHQVSWGGGVAYIHGDYITRD